MGNFICNSDEDFNINRRHSSESEEYLIKNTTNKSTKPIPIKHEREKDISAYVLYSDNDSFEEIKLLTFTDKDSNKYLFGKRFCASHVA